MLLVSKVSPPSTRLADRRRNRLRAVALLDLMRHPMREDPVAKRAPRLHRVLDDRETLKGKGPKVVLDNSTTTIDHESAR